MSLKSGIMIIVLSLTLMSCGGSSDSTSPVNSAPQTPDTSAPPPQAQTGTSLKGIFTGSAKMTASGTDVTASAIVTEELEAIVTIGEQGAMLKVNLSADDAGNIDAQGLNFEGSAFAAQTVSVTGTLEESGFSLSVSYNGEQKFDVSLMLDANMTSEKVVINGYYEDIMAGQSAGLVVVDEMIEGNDTNNCHYHGTLVSIADNAFTVLLTVEDIGQLSCFAKGEYEGMAAVLDSGDGQGSQLLLALFNSQYALVRSFDKVSEEAKFNGFAPGMYYQDSATEFEDLSFAISHDGEMTGVFVNKLFAGYFNAVPRYMGSGFVMHDEYVIYYDRGAWVTVKGNLTIADKYWERLFDEQGENNQSSEREYGDFADIMINITDEPTFTGQTELAIRKQERADYPIQFSDVVGRYTSEQANIDLSVAANGELSGQHHGCDISGGIEERSDTSSQEFSITMTRIQCPQSNSFSLDGDFSGFGFGTSDAEQGSFALHLFLSGYTSKGDTVNLITLRSQDKQ